MIRPIKTFIINLENRADRKSHAKEQFADRLEFEIEIVKAIANKKGAQGLWLTLQQIIDEKIPTSEEFILICEDDHQFTEHYTPLILGRAIAEAKQKEADLLLGGVSWFNDAIQVAPGLFWLDQFNGLQFTIIFRKFFKTILEADFGENDAADYKLSALSNKKFVTHPFISVQKEFGYSDVTAQNNKRGYVKDLFKGTLTMLRHLTKVASFYGVSANKLKNG